MDSSFVTLPLGNALTLVIDHRGRTPKKLGGDFSPSGVRVISAKNVKQGRLLLDDVRYVTHEMHDRWMPLKLQIGDTLLTSEAPLGEVFYLNSDADFCLGQRLFALRPNPALLDSRYFYYLFSSTYVQDQLVARQTGTTVEGIRQSELLKIQISFPALPKQRAIAHILGSLDDKIELNRQMNATMEDMARAIFKSWFVDFDPVHAKARGEQPAGMDAATAALFPDSFEDTELGPVPSGWGVKRLDEVAAVNGKSISKGYPFQSIEYIDISSITTGTLSGTTLYDLSEAPSRARRIVQHGDTIWSTVRPNRRSYLLIHSPTQNLVVSTGFAVLTPNLVPPAFLYQWVTTDEFVDYLTSNADGSAYPAVSADRFSAAKLICPTPAVLSHYHELVMPMYDLMNHNAVESHTLSELRDTLLPKLMSGELRVPEAAEMVEETI